jgi:hypothetical protein
VYKLVSSYSFHPREDGVVVSQLLEPIGGKYDVVAGVELVIGLFSFLQAVIKRITEKKRNRFLIR